MRSEDEMMRLILEFAEEREEILAVWMNGSRANPSAPPDRYQDFDIVFVVENTIDFQKDKSWIPRFGEIAVMQEPDQSVLFPGGETEKRYACLIQFTDGNRIDASFVRKDRALEMVREDTETVILLDKTGLLPELLPASDRMYWVKKPSQAEFEACCNEFWWTAPYVAKALCREEIIFALQLADRSVREELLRMLGWMAGFRQDFMISVGKGNKYLMKYLTEQEQAALLKTYSRADIKEAWEALWQMCGFFAQISSEAAKQMGFSVNLKEEKGSLAYIRKLFTEQEDFPCGVDFETGPC